MNTIKQKYVPCELSVVEFKVERGFAVSGEGFTRPESPSQSTVNMLWSMSATGQDYQNDQYVNNDFNWFQ